MEEAARRTNKAFTLCVTDRYTSLADGIRSYDLTWIRRSSKIELSRKWGTYMITAMLFRIYFKVG